MSGISALIGSLFTASSAPVIPDSYFGSVSLLLNGTKPSFVTDADNTVFIDTSGTVSMTTTGSPGQGTFSPHSQHGWSMMFNGTTDYIGYADDAAYQVGTGDFTIEAWVTADLVNSTLRRAYSYQSSGNTAVYLGITIGNKFTVSIRGTTGSGGDAITAVTGTTTPVAGQWYHVAAVRQSGTLKLYVDGVSEGTPISSSHNITAAQPSVGAYWYSGGSVTNYWAGHISNLRLVKGSAVYTANFTVPTSPLTAITNTSFLGYQSGSCGDNSTNKFAPTIVGGTPRAQTISPFNPTAEWSPSANGGSGYFLSGSSIATSTMPSAFGTGDFTIECWVNPDAIAATQSILGNWSSGLNTTWSLSLNTASNGISTPFFTGGSTTYMTSSVGLVPRVWNHLAVARSGTTLSMFLNGVRVSTVSNSNSFSSTNAIYVSRTPANSSIYTGFISDVRVVSSVTVYDPTATSITVPTSPLTAVTNTVLMLNFTNGAFIDYASSGSATGAGVSINTSNYQFNPSSLAFSGVNGGLNLRQPLVPLNGPFTIEFWYYQASAGTSARQLVTQYNNTGNSGRFIIYIGDVGNAGKIFVSIGSGFSTISTPTAPTSAAWHHVAVTRDTSNLFKLWVDGVLQATSTAATTTIENTSTIIGDRGSNNSPFTGNMDDVRITKGVRYTSTFTPPETAFVTY